MVIKYWIYYNVTGKDFCGFSKLEWTVIFMEAISRLWFWRNHHLHDTDSPLPSTIDLVRDILYRARNILTNLYNVSPSDISRGDHINPTLGSSFFVWP